MFDATDSPFPISDSFAMRIAVQKEMSDGWVTNAYQDTGSSPENESEAIRATMLWELGNTEVNLKLSSLSSEKKAQKLVYINTNSLRHLEH